MVTNYSLYSNRGYSWSNRGFSQCNYSFKKVFSYNISARYGTSDLQYDSEVLPHVITPQVSFKHV